MEPEFYPIEILHYLNPHLIWIERKQENPEKAFEQIGIFGLLPLKKVISDFGDVLSTNSENWVLAINLVMKEFFEKYTEFYFLCTHIDRRSSIFDDNIHKFGDIYAFTENDSQIRLSTTLADSGFAKLNESEFYQKLYSNVIKTKLNPIQSNEVVTAIEKHYNNKQATDKNDAFKRVTTITRAIKNLDTLSAKNLDTQNRKQNLEWMGNISQLVEKKNRDLLLCKGEDEMSFGRGCSRVSDSVSDTSVSKNSLKSESNEPKCENPQSSMSKIQKLLQIEKNKTAAIEVCKKVAELSVRNLAKHNSMNVNITPTDNNDNTINKVAQFQCDHSNTHNATHSNKNGINNKTTIVSNGSANIVRRGKFTTTETNTVIKQETDEEVLAEIKSKIQPTNRSKKRYIALGPPMNDVINYKIKPTDDDEKSEETMKKNKTVVKKYEQEANKVNGDEVDSAWDDGELDDDGDKSEEMVKKNMTVVKKYEQEAKNVNGGEVDSAWDDGEVDDDGEKSKEMVKKNKTVVKKYEQEVNKVNGDEIDFAWDDGEVDTYVDVKKPNVDKLKNVVDSKAENNDSFKRLRDRLRSLNDGEASAVNQIDNNNVGVNVFESKVIEITKDDTVNSSERFKKLKDSIQSRNNAKVNNVHENVDSNDNSKSTKIEPNCSQSFERLKDQIQSTSGIQTNTGVSSSPSNTITIEDQNRQIKSTFLKKIAKLKEFSSSKVTPISDSVEKSDFHKNETINLASGSSTAFNKNPDETDSDEDIDKIKAQAISENGIIEIKPKNDKVIEKLEKIERNVNPFKNLEFGKSVFVEKLVSPILMVHTKNDNLIQPHSSLREIPFKNDIKHSLKKMSVKEPNRLQSVSWHYILRSYSIFMIGPAGSGKTLGYVPAVCNLVMDDLNEIVSAGPICIIVCATAKSVCKIANLCKIFLGLDEKVIACYHGIDSADLTTSVLNGCEILVSTAPMLRKLLMTDLGVDLRRLSTLVFDDCERLFLVYEAELKTIHYYVKEMYKNRVNKQFKVQYIVASRLWCDFMRPLAKKAPSSIVSIVAFQECVLYSKASTSVELFLKDNKVNSVKEFLNQIDRSKRTVIVCRTNEEVELLENALSYHKSLFVCNDKMTLHDCHNMNAAWRSYKEPVLGPILICCDGNLTLLNVTDAHYLIHFSMPELFSMFCKRFAVLNDNYASIFNQKANEVKIKIMLDENNVEQLPKILNFVKRCTSEVPEALEEIAKKVLEQKDYQKGKKFVPLCDSMLSLSECSDFWNCEERHAVLKEFDEPKDWMPRHGFITFKILHFDTAVTYSAKLLSHVIESETVKNYPTTYSMLSLKMGMYFSKESNRKLHGIPQIGDVCAVAVKPNFYTRCKVIKILTYYKGNPLDVLINLIDEEQLETVRDVYLYHLPEEFKGIETHVVKVRLANIQPQDKDVTYSDLAKYQIKKIIEGDEHLYLRGEVALTVGNTIFVNTLEACQDLVSLNETVVKHDLKTELLESHAKANPDHVTKLKKLCQVGGLEVEFEKPKRLEKVKLERNCRWAYLPKDELVEVIFAGASDPSKFFVVLTKFDPCVRLLISDIKKYVEENQNTLESYEVGDVVLAEFPDDNTFERARIEEILDDKVYCLFVDRGDMRDVSVDKIKYLPDNLIEQLPFQVIECRLIGVKPPATEWSEFSINWLCDMCLESREGVDKTIYLKCFTKEKAEITGGNKYGVLLIDTNTSKDLNINKMMIELNLAREIEDEMKYLDDPIISETEKVDDELIDAPEKNAANNDKSIVPLNMKDDTSESDIEVKPLNIFPGRPIRSVPLVDDNISDDDFDLNLSGDLAKAFGLKDLITPRLFNNASNTSTQHSEDSSPMKVKMLMISANSKTDDNIASTSKDNIIDVSNVESADNIQNNIRTDTQNGDQQQDLQSNVTDVINLSHGATEGNNILNSTQLETAENTTSAEDVLFEDKTSPINRKGSLDDPNIVLDIEQYTPTTSNVFKMFAKSKFGLMATKNVKIDDIELSQENVKTAKSDIDSDDFSSTDISQEIDKKLTETEPPRKPKLIWRQNKNSVTIKIQLIGVENYKLEIHERSIIFFCDWNDTPYEFNIDLYGVINIKKSRHANKGQYIQINLEKLLKKKWMNLTKDDKIKKWIVYDVDSIDTSSDEENVQVDDSLQALKQQFESHDTDSDDDFDDDISFKYNKHR